MRSFKWVTFGAVVACAVGLSAAEKPTESYQANMKTAAATLGSIGRNATAKNYDGLAADAATLKATFAEVNTFWAARKLDTALKASGAVAQAAADLETAAKARNEEGVAAARKALGAGCGSCHQQHREKVGDTFQIK